jgi:hypothetical protein
MNTNVPLPGDKPVTAEAMIDLTFDQIFESRSKLPWWPWVGRRFSESPVKTMFVGESIYEWNPERDLFGRRYAKADGLRVTHGNHAMNFARKSAYVRNIERAVFAAASPIKERKQSLWLSIAYHNLVLRPMPSAKHRPRESDYREGGEEVFELCRILSIEQCLVYGLEPAKLRAMKDVSSRLDIPCTVRAVASKIGSNQAKVAIVGDGPSTLRLLFVRHPSAFFSWRKWGPVIRENLDLRQFA